MSEICTVSKKRGVLEELKVIAITHKNVVLDEIGKFHLADDERTERLRFLKTEMNLGELMYLSTCNRVEFLFTSDQTLTPEFIAHFFKAFNSYWTIEQSTQVASIVSSYEGEDAVRHILSVASSIESMVIGEREIITQVRNAYELCYKEGLTGDFLRILIRRTIETAKQVYTHTEIARKPVSVVSLAYHKLKELNIRLDSRFLIIGSGQTNTTMSKFLKKHGFTNFVVYNRTLENAKVLADDLQCEARSLDELKNHKEGFDVIMTCTASATNIITKSLYETLLAGDTGSKVVIDLAIPNDFDPSIADEYKVKHISVDFLKVIAEENLKLRSKELVNCKSIINENVVEFETIYKDRSIELAFSQVPKVMKEIKPHAISEVFAKEVANLDKESREVLEKILGYVEKKYISIPMRMAKEIIGQVK